MLLQKSAKVDARLVPLNTDLGAANDAVRDASLSSFVHENSSNSVSFESHLIGAEDHTVHTSDTGE
ncbi:MAG: hypothetical protein P8P83_02335 [Rickettsiaceae bacterium]|nr:hypothetical protein [Rickettsiaceae bacterium]